MIVVYFGKTVTPTGLEYGVENEWIAVSSSEAPTFVVITCGGGGCGFFDVFNFQSRRW